MTRTDSTDAAGPITMHQWITSHPDYLKLNCECGWSVARPRPEALAVAKLDDLGKAHHDDHETRDVVMSRLSAWAAAQILKRDAKHIRTLVTDAMDAGDDTSAIREILAATLAAASIIRKALRGTPHWGAAGRWSE